MTTDVTIDMTPYEETAPRPVNKNKGLSFDVGVVVLLR